ncbi:MAG: hypothetical protein ACLTAI_01785 [Thomasclavelia sp.]
MVFKFSKRWLVTSTAASGKRPNLVSLDGWAGFQRYARYAGLET